MLQTLSLLLLAPIAQSAQVASDDPSAIRVQDLQAHIGYLASDELEGRESGTRGGLLAAKYSAHHFEKLGLEPLGKDGSYLLPFENLRGGDHDYHNAAGLLPGTDPSLRDEILVIGGHHDHAGIGGPGAMGFPGEIHNGADDNASGASGVLELAEYFVAHPTERPILFITFAAEESGLLGSAWFANSGPIPADHMRAMINLDMIGRSQDGYVFIGGLGTAREFHGLLDGLLEDSGLTLELSDLGEAPSDNTSFYKAGVPALFFFTNIHDDYHMPGDDVDKINYAGEVKILELVRDMAVKLNAHDGPLTWEEQPGIGMPRDFQQRMMSHMTKIMQRAEKRGKLGILNTAELENGLRIGAVRQDGAIAGAGVEAGDVLVELEGRAILNTEDLRRALGGKMRGDEVKLIIEREGQRKKLTVTLK